MRFLKYTAAILSLTLAPCVGAEFNSWNWGPFYHRYEYGDQQSRVKALGPLVESRTYIDDVSTFAVRPFFSISHLPQEDRVRREFLWPLASVRDFKQQRSWHVLVMAHGTNFDVDDKESRYRIRIFPLYFQGRNIDGDNHLAFFPLGGRIHEVLGRDQVDFVLFPLWMRHSVNEVVTNEWLFPIISRTTGPKDSRFRVFPFYGVSEREGQFNKRFVLWPIWTQSEWYRAGNSGSGYILFPLWGRAETELESTLYVLPPFFRFTRGEKLDMTHAPWPIYQRIVGENIDRLYIWPIWGRHNTHKRESMFFLWPIARTEVIDQGHTEKTHTRIVPFYYHYHEDWKTAPVDEDRNISRYFKLWPLLSYERDGVNTEFNALSLWPGRDPEQIERNWAPLWRLYTRSTSENSSESELLWGIYRSEQSGESRSRTIFPLASWHRGPEKRGWSVLNGLAGHQKNGRSSSWQILYLFNFGDRGEQQ